ncbi:MAG: hypothetical protein OXG59_03465 [Gammaproteobacteria bacterium]|nr:hypothetical protein [Gammaproteobacteria bacterium]MYH34965.1 hypothetical protein [Gammaproteobacteria bacterium]MYL01342.1 hypothetical protein [Gammaproteobacteria bacterium]
MNYRTPFLPALACAFALVAGPSGADAISDAGTAPGMERLSSDQIGELKELLIAHGIPPARQLAGEITQELTGSNREAAKAALFRPPAVQPQGAAPTPAAVVQAGQNQSVESARAVAPYENSSPLRNLLRKVLRFLNFPN